MTLSVAAAVLALAAAQATSPRGDGQPAVPRVDAQGITHVLPPDQQTQQEPPPDTRATIPYLPDPGDRRSGRPTLDLGLMGLMRTRTFTNAAGATDAYVDLELTPGLAANAEAGAWTLALGYAPRLTLPSVSQGYPLLVLHNATLRAEWRVSRAWTLLAEGTGTYGDYNQLVPTVTPGVPPGGGGQPAPPDPIRSTTYYPYVNVDAWLRVLARVSARTALRVSGGYRDLGGLGAVGQAQQPRYSGPQGAVDLEWDTAASSRLTTTLAGQSARFQDGSGVLLGSLTESWRMRPSVGLELNFTAGAAMSSTAPSTHLDWGHLLPVAGATLTWSTERSEYQPLRLTAGLSLGPYVDPYVEIAYQRVLGSVGVEWRPSRVWVIGASLSAALVPYATRPAEAYGSLGASVGFVPWRILECNLGAFTTRQVEGPSVATQDVRQWTIILFATLRDLIYL